ncbi:MAG: glycosyltransferase [Gemmatimonadetes bacterium]|nr:glycosyltransferase [Gemmatimonadota bacterium]
MRVLFLLNSLNVGGYEQLMLDVFRHLRRQGHEITTVCLKKKGNLAGEFEQSDIPVLSDFVRNRFDMLAPLRVRDALKGREFDLIFLEMGRNALLAGEFIASALGDPVRVSSIHGTGVPEQGSLFRKGQKALLNRLGGIVSCAHTQSRYLIADEGIDPSLLKVIVNGVDHTRFAPDDKGPGPLGAEARKSIATVASLTPEKGHLAFVEAAAIALKTVPDARFYIIGGGPEQERIENEIRSRNLQESVIMLGIRRDLPALLPHFRAVALASIPFRETLPISTMEAMSCGTPTINTNVGSVPDLVEHGVTGLLVPPGDLGALGAAFTELLVDEQKAEAMGRAARKRVEEHFTMVRALQEYEEYFFEMVSRGRGRTRGSLSSGT